MDERISAMAPKVLLEHGFCAIGGFVVVVTFVHLIKFYCLLKISTSNLPTDTKPENVIGNP